MGYAVMATGIASGPNRAIEAAHLAMASPLLEAGAIDGARGILINITGSSSLKLNEVNDRLHPHPGRRPRGRQHHLRRRTRRVHGRPDQDHRHRHRLPRPQRQQLPAPRLHAPAVRPAHLPSRFARLRLRSADRQGRRTRPQHTGLPARRRDRPGHTGTRGRPSARRPTRAASRNRHAAPRTGTGSGSSLPQLRHHPARRLPPPRPHPHHRARRRSVPHHRHRRRPLRPRRRRRRDRTRTPAPTTQTSTTPTSTQIPTRTSPPRTPARSTRPNPPSSTPA